MAKRLFVSCSNLTCSRSSATLIRGGATSYTWNNGVTNNIAFTPLVSNTYQVTGIDVNNFINSTTTSITINPVPEVSNQNLNEYNNVFTPIFSNKRKI